MWFQLAGCPAIFTIQFQFQIRPKCWTTLDVTTFHLLTQYKTHNRSVSINMLRNMACLVGWQTVPYFWLEMSVGRRCWLTMSVAKLNIGPTMTAVWHDPNRTCAAGIGQILWALVYQRCHTGVWRQSCGCYWTEVCVASSVTQLAAFVPCW